AIRDADPRWLSETNGPTSDPLAVYEHTYSAITDRDLGPERPPRGRRVRAGILAVFAIGAVAIGLWLGLGHVRLPSLPRIASDDPPRVLPVPRSAYAPEVIGTTPARAKATLR